MSEWQDISTAPKDGSYLLVTDGENVRIAIRKRFSEEHFERTGKHWYEWFRSDEHCPGHTWSIEPTHWMPLPKAPDTPSGSD